jgi:hypothetical protein
VIRFYQFLLIGSTLLLSWLGMMAVHELGHCAAARLTGGAVARVVLHPLTISRTDLARNPHPLVVAWAGAVAGSILPLAFLVVVSDSSTAYLFRFFAGFCLVINGVYLAEDSFFRIADSGDLMRYGSPAWAPVAFGVAAMALGLWLWNGQGRHFGFAGSRGQVDRGHAAGVFYALLAVIAVELAFSRW